MLHINKEKNIIKQNAKFFNLLFEALSKYEGKYLQ